MEKVDEMCSIKKEVVSDNAIINLKVTAIPCVERFGSEGKFCLKHNRPVK